jgi:hypothetical protein
MIWRHAVALVTTIGLAAVACGGDDDTESIVEQTDASTSDDQADDQADDATVVPSVDDTSVDDLPADDGTDATEPPVEDAPTVTYDVSGMDLPLVCELVTAAEMEAIVGVSVQTDDLTPGKCSYLGDAVDITINVRPEARPGVARDAAKLTSTNVVEDISGLGDDAISIVDPQVGEAFVQVATGPFNIQVSNRGSDDLTFLRDVAQAVVAEPAIANP